MTDTQTKAAWLGDNNPFYERFPICDLNEKQVATLVGFSGIRVTGLGPSPAIRRLTDSGIVEVTVRWAKNDHEIGSGGELWIAGNGDYIAAAHWEGATSGALGPIRVYRWMPGRKLRRFGEEAEEVTYKRSDGHQGAVDGTRAFIKEHWLG